MMPTPEVARRWLNRWDRQQEYYLPDREERFAVLNDVVATVVGPDPLVLDLGAGPGSTSARLLDRLPNATVVAVDADPLLLGLARAAYGDRPGLRFVAHDLRDPGWTDALALNRALDAVVSTTALHWLTASELAAVYGACGRLLRRGGVLVNVDHLPDAPVRPGLDRLATRVAEAHAGRLGRSRSEDWDEWWAAVSRAPELAELRENAEVTPVDHSVPDPPGLDDHVRMLREAGFAEVGTVWQLGPDRALVALR